MRIVLDTNVLVSGLMLPDSIPGRIVRAWRSASFTLALSLPMLEEIGRVLRYPKIAARLGKVGIGELEVEHLLSLLQFQADIVDIGNVEANVPDDPNNAHILATYLAAKAEYLVSGDTDLLALRNTYSILTPQEFWQRCG